MPLEADEFREGGKGGLESDALRLGGPEISIVSGSSIVGGRSVDVRRSIIDPVLRVGGGGGIRGTGS